MTKPSSRSLIFEVKSTGSELAFGRLQTSSEDFGRLRKTSDFFGNLRKWSCRVQKSQHSQDKNLTLISQKSWQVYKHFLFLKHLYIKGIYFLSLNRNYLSFTNIFLCFFNELDHLHLKKITTNIKIITLQELEDSSHDLQTPVVFGFSATQTRACMYRCLLFSLLLVGPFHTSNKGNRWCIHAALEGSLDNHQLEMHPCLQATFPCKIEGLSYYPWIMKIEIKNNHHKFT